MVLSASMVKGAAGVGERGGTTSASLDEVPRLKAAIVYNICKFVHWPASGEEDLVLGVLGQDGDGPDFATIDGKPINGRNLTVRALQDLGEPAGLQVLFLGSRCRADLEKTLARANGSPVLTISEISDFGHRGGIIQLVMEEQRIRFYINPAAAERAGLRLSSQLLKMARIIEEEG